jgi:hypothetical protein
MTALLVMKKTDLVEMKTWDVRQLNSDQTAAIYGDLPRVDEK